MLGVIASYPALLLPVLRRPQLGLHCSQLVPQLRIDQQEALQLFLQLRVERELEGGALRAAAAPPHFPAPVWPRPHRLGLLASAQQISVVCPKLISLFVCHLLELSEQRALLLRKEGF